MNNRIVSTGNALALCLAVGACWSCGNSKTVASKAPAAEPTTVAAAEPAQAIGAHSAFYEMYRPARQWASDVMPLMISSGEVPGIKNEAGKAGMWTAVFVSPGKRQARTFHYAVAQSGNEIGKGVTIGRVQEWGGATPKSKPFSSAEFAIDSDAAYATAANKAGLWLKKNPAKKLSIYLGSESRFAGPTWYFMWGDRKAGYLAFVSATTGQPLAGK